MQSANDLSTINRQCYTIKAILLTNLFSWLFILRILSSWIFTWTAELDYTMIFSECEQTEG